MYDPIFCDRHNVGPSRLQIHEAFITGAPAYEHKLISGLYISQYHFITGEDLRPKNNWLLMFKNKNTTGYVEVNNQLLNEILVIDLFYETFK